MESSAGGSGGLGAVVGWLCAGAVVCAVVVAMRGGHHDATGGGSSPGPASNAPPPSAATTGPAAPTAMPVVQLETPDVPALQQGEVPPVDLPNYFAPRELGTTALVAFNVCVDAMAQGSPDASEGRRSAGRLRGVSRGSLARGARPYGEVAPFPGCGGTEPCAVGAAAFTSPRASSTLRRVGLFEEVWL